jgi:RNA polymerase sigma-70 factor (ECF subfamily)
LKNNGNGDLVASGKHTLSAEENEFFKELVESMSSDLLRIANSELRNLDDSKDSLQETLLAAYNNIDKLMSSKNPRGWLVNTLRFKIMHMQRAKFRYIKLQEKLKSENGITATTPFEDYYGSDIQAIIMKDEYKILRLLYEEGYSVREVADKLGIKYETCKKRIQIARHKLKQEIEKNNFPQS